VEADHRGEVQLTPEERHRDVGNFARYFEAFLAP
jgi:hypothetical protein